MLMRKATPAILKRSHQMWPVKTGSQSLAMEGGTRPDHTVEEGTRDGCGGVRVAKRNEVRVFGEAVDHSEDDKLAADFPEALDEVHRNIRPHLSWNVEGLQQASGLQRLRLVALACAARAHPILDKGAVTRDVEVGTESM